VINVNAIGRARLTEWAVIGGVCTLSIFGLLWAAMWHVVAVSFLGAALVALIVTCLAAGALLLVQRTPALRRRLALERSAVDHADGEIRQSALSAIRVHTLSDLSTLQADDGECYTRMLQLACRSIRPGKRMRGTLTHLDGELLVYDAVAWTGTTRVDPARKTAYPGHALPFVHSIQALLHLSAGTRAWDDVVPAATGLLPSARLVGVRAMIGTPLKIGGRLHFIVFSSPQTADDAPFSAADIEYVQIVASLFSSKVQESHHVEQLRYQIEHDVLTGLETRVQFRKAIRAEIADNRPFALALLNLDNFRQLNEVEGQVVCDEILVATADALRAIGPHALAARLNGDEFGILLRDTTAANVEAALRMALEPFRRPFQTAGRDGTRLLAVNASVGCALYPIHGATPEALLRCADVALAVEKEEGGGDAVVFDQAMKLVLERRRFESGDIERALANDEFRLMYQPSFDLRTGRIDGAEALIRWDHPERGEIPPADFIPTAERNRLIGPISRWVFGRVARDVLSTDDLPPGFRVFFNLSAQNLEDLSFLEMLTAAVQANPRLGDRLGVEITETTAMQNVARSLTTLGLIRSLGIRIAVDDFGTGYSSLSYLKRLPVDVIKIDRSFVTGLPGDDKDAALVETMVGICNRLEIASLAEGIETEAQRAWLTEHGCGYGQGYLVDRPLPFDQLLTRFNMMVTV
jgi:diguanylate cyclase (GGDEF)-like protein